MASELTIIEKINKLVWFDAIEKLRDILRQLRDLSVPVYLTGGTGITVLGEGSQENPYVINGSPVLYKSYIAQVTQLGTNAPTVTVYHNDTGITFTGVRQGTGSYLLTGSGGTMNTTTAVFISKGRHGGGDGWVCALVNNNLVQITTVNSSGVLADSIIGDGCYIEIKIYNY